MNENNEGGSNERKTIISLPISILAAAILISGAVIYSANQKGTALPPSAGDPSAFANGEEQAQTITVSPIGERDIVMGDKNAKVTLIEYGDYQCPFCGRFFAQVEPDLIDDYVDTGKVKFVYRDLAFLGPESVAAAEAAECSKDQNKFWQFHDAIYMEEIKDGQEHNNNLNRNLFVKLAGQVGMDTDEFVKCYDSKKYSQVVAESVQASQRAGINSTPTSFIMRATSETASFIKLSPNVDAKEKNGNGQEISGAQPFAAFVGVIDALLK